MHCHRVSWSGYPGPASIATAYPDPDIPAQQAVGVAIAVINKMVNDTDNQKKAENETVSYSTRYT